MNKQDTPAEPAYPRAWSVEVVRNASGRAWYFVSRFTSRTAVQYVLEGFSDEPAKYRTRAAADAVVLQLNRAKP